VSDAATAGGAVMAAAPTSITVDITGLDCVKDALARREAKISELQDLIRLYVCHFCSSKEPGPDCEPCSVYDSLRWDGERQ